MSGSMQCGKCGAVQTRKEKCVFCGEVQAHSSAPSGSEAAVCDVTGCEEPAVCQLRIDGDWLPICQKHSINKLIPRRRLPPTAQRSNPATLDAYMDLAQVWHKQAGRYAASDTFLTMMRMDRWARRLAELTGKPETPLRKISDAEDALLAEHVRAVRQIEWLWANCKIVYWDKDDLMNYPIEHNPHAQKYARPLIEAEMPNGTRWPLSLD